MDAVLNGLDRTGNGRIPLHVTTQMAAFRCIARHHGPTDDVAEYAPKNLQKGLDVAATLARKLMAALYEQLGSGYEEPEVSDLGWTAKSSLTLELFLVGRSNCSGLRVAA